MYSRYSNRQEKPIRLPEHYSGCAFSEYRSEESPNRSFGVAKPSPPPSEPESKPTPPIIELPSTPPDIKSPPTKESHDVLPKSDTDPQKALPVVKSLFDGLGKGLTLSKGLDFDQLLILGLILLLAHTDRDSDIVWWLGLLLLCG